jgi:hypothetical protein
MISFIFVVFLVDIFYLKRPMHAINFSRKTNVFLVDILLTIQILLLKIKEIYFLRVRQDILMWMISFKGSK